MPAATIHKIEIEISNEAFAHRRWEPKVVADEMRILWLVEEVRQRRLGFGKAAELAGVAQAQFLDVMSQQKVTPFDYDADELDAELT